MQLQRFTDSKEFSHHVQSYLLEYEAEHNLLLGILNTLVCYPERYPEPAYLACVYDSSGESRETTDKILAVAIRTPPFKLVLSQVHDLKALKLIAQDLQKHSQSLPGVGGLVTEAEAFLQEWQSLTGHSYRRVMKMRIHALTQVEPVLKVNGQLRVATEGDRPLLLDWVQTFAAEIGEVVSDNPEKIVDLGLKRQSMYLWEDGRPVSWASGSRFLPKAARIGPVYTPAEYRRKGYATACVAALSQRLLDEGCDRCFLFTDLANPTSNHIYQQIGYRPICDWIDCAIDTELTQAHPTE